MLSNPMVINKNIRFWKKAGDRQGFTLTEIVITMVILGFLSLILFSFFSSITHSPDPIIRERAVALGQALMDEITSRRWDENTSIGGGPLNTDESARGSVNATLRANLGTDAGEPAPAPPGAASDRRTWDDVDDYNGLDETSGYLTDQEFNTIPLTGYRRQVRVGYLQSNVDPINQNTLFESAMNYTDTKLIKITVTSPLNETYTFVAALCNL